jgi:hypothetical protein
MSLEEIAIAASSATLIVSIIALVISIKGRKNNLRENLYNRQLDLFQELFSDVIELEELLLDWKIVQEELEKESDLFEIKELEEEIEELEEDIEDLSDELDMKLSKAQLLLPDEMAEQFDNFMKYFNKIDWRTLKKSLKGLDLKEFGHQVFELEDSIREHIGLEKLSKANRKVM